MQGKIHVLRHEHQPSIGTDPVEDRLNELRLQGYTIISVYPVRTDGRTAIVHEIVVSEPVSMKDLNAINKAIRDFNERKS